MFKLMLLIFGFFIFSFKSYSQVSVLNRTTEYQKFEDSGFIKISSAKGLMKFQLSSNVILSTRTQLGNPDSLYRIALVYETRRIKPIVFRLTFSSEGNSLSKLYFEIKKAFEKENIGNKNYSSNIKVGNNIVTVTSAKIIGREWVLFSFYDVQYDPPAYMSVAMTENELDKLFLFNSNSKK